MELSLAIEDDERLYPRQVLSQVEISASLATVREEKLVPSSVFAPVIIGILMNSLFAVRTEGNSVR